MISQRLFPAPRFVLFGALCALWLTAMAARPDSAWIAAAGLAWFTTWGIQIAIAVTSWVRPFSLPRLYYAPWSKRQPRVRRLFGVDHFGRIARWVHPFPFDRRSPHDLETTMRMAETTHGVSFVIVLVLTVASASRGALVLTFFLVLWNLLFNLYPVVLQRRNRARLRRLARRSAAVPGVRRPSGLHAQTHVGGRLPTGALRS